jgi:hypothetical protein
LRSYLNQVSILTVPAATIQTEEHISHSAISGGLDVVKLLAEQGIDFNKVDKVVIALTIKSSAD